MTPFDSEAAARAMLVHRVAVAHSCWLRVTADGTLEGCPIGALYFAAHSEVANAGTIITWAGTATASTDYVAGFDDGFHAFVPSRAQTTDYALGLSDGRRTRVLVDTAKARLNSPPLFRPLDPAERAEPTRN